MFFPLEMPAPPGILSTQLCGRWPSQPLLGSPAMRGYTPLCRGACPSSCGGRDPGQWVAQGGCSTESAEGFPGPRVLAGVCSPQPDHSGCPERRAAGLGSLASAPVTARVGAALVVLWEPTRRGSGCRFSGQAARGCVHPLHVGRGQLTSPGPSHLTRSRPQQPPLWEGPSAPCPLWSRRGGHALTSMLRRRPETPWKEATVSHSPSSRPAQVPSVEGSSPPAS